MSAYHLGFEGAVAAWAVRKQKGHRGVEDSTEPKLTFEKVLYLLKISPKNLANTTARGFF